MGPKETNGSREKTLAWSKNLLEEGSTNAYIRGGILEAYGSWARVV